jgi:thioredoxin 1
LADIQALTEPSAVLDILRSGEEVVLLFTAPSWCAPCKRLEPVFPKVAENFGDEVNFIVADLLNAPMMVMEFDIQQVPTIKYYRGGEFITELHQRNVLQLTKEIQDVGPIA